MKFDINIFSTLAVLLTCIESGYSRHELYEESEERQPSPPQRLNRQEPRREPSPPRGRFANIPRAQRATLGRGLLASIQGGGFHPIDNTYSVMPSLQGFITMVQDANGWVSGIYYPETHELVQVNRYDIADVRPITPGLVPSDEYIQLWGTANFVPFRIRRVRD